MLKKAYDILTKFEMAIMSGMFIFLSFAIVADVICRKTINVSFSWLQELSRTFFIISTFMGTSLAVTRDDHPRMTAVLEFLPPKARKIMQCISDLICVALFSFVCYFAFRQVGNVARMGTMTQSLKIPLYLIYAIIPISTLGMVIRYIFRIVDRLRRDPEGGEAQ